MIYRKLPGTDIEITAVTFGAWAIGGWMWGGTDEEQAIAAIRRGIELGITTIDTAAVYGFGLSEELVGKAIEPFNRENLQILTKCGLRWDLGETNAPVRWETQGRDGKPLTISHYAKADSVIYECEQSLRRLNTDCIDLFQIHRPDPHTPVEETMEAMSQLLTQGKIRAIGVSNYTIEMLEAARKAVTISTSQPPYSMLLRDIENDLMPYCIEHDIATIVYSPLQRGLLTGKITPNYKFGPNDHRATNPLFSDENVNRVNAFLADIRPIADAHSATLAQLVINWTVFREGITAALVGARNPQQIEENAAALDFTLSDDETTFINAKLDQLELVR